MRRAFLLMIPLLFFGISTNAADYSGLDRIESVLADFDQLDLEFEQYVHGAEGELVEYATGRFIMQRPKFRWMVDDPYPQVIVSNGEWLKVFDPDLEQLTESSLADALEGTPLGILSRKDGRIRDEFDVLSHDAKAGTDYFMLAPRKPQSKAQRVEIWLEGATLKRLDVTDESGGRLRLQFKASSAEAWSGDPWVLEVPPGTDIVKG